MPSEIRLDVAGDSRVVPWWRFRVIALDSPKALQTEAGLELVGPRAFGFDLDFRPLFP